MLEKILERNPDILIDPKTHDKLILDKQTSTLHSENQLTSYPMIDGIFDLFPGATDKVSEAYDKHSTKYDDLVKEVKRCSTNFINQYGISKNKFAWQEGYGAFSYSKSQNKVLISYIKNQDRHHLKQTFKEEYIQILNKYNVKYNEKWILKMLFNSSGVEF